MNKIIKGGNRYGRGTLNRTSGKQAEITSNDDDVPFGVARKPAEITSSNGVAPGPVQDEKSSWWSMLGGKSKRRKNKKSGKKSRRNNRK